MKLLDTKLEYLNNKEIHFMTKNELIKKIDLIVFSDYYAKQNHEIEKNKDFVKVMATTIQVKSIAKNLKGRFSHKDKIPHPTKPEEENAEHFENVQNVDVTVEVQKTVEEI